MVDFVSLFTGISERDIGYLLKNMVQKTINDQLTNTEISSIDNKTPVLITNSKDVELANDIAIQSAINVETPTNYYMTEEPDGVNLKLYLKFQNAGELRDWSYQKNKSFSTGANTMPGLFSKYNEKSMLKYELYSYFNGISHYAYTLDSPTVRILPNITASKVTSFFMRVLPISLSNVLYADNRSLFTKVDDDQLRYGYSVTVDSNGSINFYVKNDYRQYHLFIKDAYNYILSDPLYVSNSNFRFENFNKRNFLTGYAFLCSLVDAELPFHDWFFKYNPTTHNMSAINTSESNLASVFADTSLVTPAPAVSCPIQEGKYTHSGTVQSTIYDNSGNNRNGTITNIATGGVWNDDNTLTNLGGDVLGTGANALQIDFGSISALNTLTEFTIAFWFNPLDNVTNPHNYYERIVTKAGQGPSEIWIERRSSLNELEFNISNGSGVYSFVRFPNAFPNTNKWYFIVCKWKSGEKLKIYVDNVEIQGAANLTHTISNSANNLRIFYTNRSPNCKLALFKFYTTQISTLVQDDLFYQGYHNPLFPKSENIQPVAEEDPDPILIPFNNIYTLDKMTTPVAGDYRKINSLAGNNSFTELHSVADGTSVTDPELNPYTIADGTGGAGSPFVRIGAAPATIDSSDNSAGKVGAGQNDAYALWLDVDAGTGIGDTINGKVITKAIIWMRRPTSSVTGTLYCRIWNATGTTLTPVATLGSMPASAVAAGSSGSDWDPYEFINTANTVAMADGYKIGIEYQGYGGDDVIDIQRKSSPTDLTAIQTTYDGDWDDDGNNAFTMKCDLYTGLGTTSSDPNVIMKSGSYSRVVQAFGSGDTLIGKTIGKVTLRLKKVGSPTGTATIAIVSSASTLTIKATLGTLNVATLTTTTADYTFSNYVHGYAAASTDRIGIIWTPSASGEVHVMTNAGNTGGGNTWNGTNSSVFTYISSWSATGFTTVDLAGKIYTGGNNFDAFLRFNAGSVTRLTTKIVNLSSGLHNRKITRVRARIKKNGTVGGPINCYIRDASDNIKVTFSSVDAGTLTTSYADYDFDNVIHTYYTNNGGTTSGDKISFEYPSGDASNYVEFNSNKDVYNGLNTITQTYDGVNYTDLAQRDLAGKTFTGGEPDLTSRTRVAQSIEHQDSRLKGKKITRVKVFLYRTTVGTSGTVYCNIMGTNDELIKTIGSTPVSALSTTVGSPSAITFEDTTNNYPMNVDDKVAIEFNGGNATDQVGVLVREVTPNYDGSFSYIRKYDGVDYDDEEPTKDLCAVMDEGGFEYTPDPGSIPDPTPTNIKDLLYVSGNNAKSGFLESFLMEFRIYAKDITLQMADNLYDNRYTISSIGAGEILMPYSLRPVTLDAV